MKMRFMIEQLYNVQFHVYYFISARRPTILLIDIIFYKIFKKNIKPADFLKLLLFLPQKYSRSNNEQYSANTFLHSL